MFLFSASYFLKVQLDQVWLYGRMRVCVYVGVGVCVYRCMSVYGRVDVCVYVGRMVRACLGISARVCV